MIGKLRAFGGFWYDFLVGDDWRIAAGVLAALAITYGVSQTSLSAWWILPIASVITLSLSVVLESRRRS
ncbi:MAG TPA: hypothetical protein VE441_03075 [Mycobacterium sp.]|nr:hypothetical protein [Mycobacterium sp.]